MNDQDKSFGLSVAVYSFGNKLGRYFPGFSYVLSFHCTSHSYSKSKSVYTLWGIMRGHSTPQIVSTCVHAVDVCSHRCGEISSANHSYTKCMLSTQNNMRQTEPYTAGWIVGSPLECIGGGLIAAHS